MRFSGTVRLRPIRIGFLVQPNDLATVRKVTQLCSCLWGGLYNPIIPFVGENVSHWVWPRQKATGPDITRGYIDFFEPDVLVEQSPGMAEALGWKNEKQYFDLPRTIELNKFNETDVRGRLQFAAGIDVFDVVARELFSSH